MGAVSEERVHMNSRGIVHKIAARLPTPLADFDLHLYLDRSDGKEHLAICLGLLHEERDVLVRVHSECFTGDVLRSRRCDCGEQLQHALRAIAAEGQGALIYLRQEGRGIGLLEKLRAYNLQDEGYDTIEANLILGHGADEREYSIAAHILQDLGVASIRLLTNNPAKIEGLRQHGITVMSRVPSEMPVHADNMGYLRTKHQRMHHLIHVDPAPNGQLKKRAHRADDRRIRAALRSDP
jgi:GTP cyclohydrolase II